MHLILTYVTIICYIIKKYSLNTQEIYYIVPIILILIHLILINFLLGENPEIIFENMLHLEYSKQEANKLLKSLYKKKKTNLYFCFTLELVYLIKYSCKNYFFLSNILSICLNYAILKTDTIIIILQLLIFIPQLMFVLKDKNKHIKSIKLLKP